MTHFIAWQLLRTPRSLQLHRDAASRAAKGDLIALIADKAVYHAAMKGEYESEEECEHARQRSLSGGWHIDSDEFTGLHMMVHIAPTIRLWLTLMDWTAYSGRSYSLMTSDNPVATWSERVGKQKTGVEVGVGFGDPAMRLSFPVAPRLALVATHTRYSLTAINNADLSSARLELSTWRPQFRHVIATDAIFKKFNRVAVSNADQYVYHSERDAKVELFLSRHFLNKPAPVRRCDRLPIYS